MIVTAPVLSPASIVSVAALRLKSDAVAGATGDADTATVTSSCHFLSSEAVTLASPPSSAIAAGATARVNDGRWGTVASSPSVSGSPRVLHRAKAASPSQSVAANRMTLTSPLFRIPLRRTCHVAASSPARTPPTRPPPTCTPSRTTSLPMGAVNAIVIVNSSPSYQVFSGLKRAVKGASVVADALAVAPGPSPSTARSSKSYAVSAVRPESTNPAALSCPGRLDGIAVQSGNAAAPARKRTSWRRIPAPAAGAFQASLALMLPACATSKPVGAAGWAKAGETDRTAPAASRNAAARWAARGTRARMRRRTRARRPRPPMASGRAVLRVSAFHFGAGAAWGKGRSAGTRDGLACIGLQRMAERR